MVRLYFDVHIPLTVAEQLSKRGIDVLTAQADNSATLPDHELLARATSLVSFPRPSTFRLSDALHSSLPLLTDHFSH